MAAFNAGRWAEARAHAADALARAPASYEALHITALAHLNSGEAGEALPHVEQLVERFPGDPFARNTHGAVLQQLGRGEGAIAAYRRATELNAQYLDAWLNLGRAYAEAGRHEEALPAYDHLVRAGQSHPALHMLRGISLLEVGQLKEGAESLKRAVQVDPSLSVAQLSLSRAAYLLGDFDTALASGRAALRAMPDSLEAKAAVAQAEMQAGDAHVAIEGFKELQGLSPAPGRWRFLRALAWPPISESREQIAARRASMERALDELIAEPARIADPAREIDMTSFYVNYQHFDDTATQSKIAQAYRLACPGLEWTAPHIARPRDPSKRIRLGILSSHLRNHTIGKLNIGLAQHFDRKRFELVILRPESAPDFLSAAFDQAAEGRAVSLPRDLEAARRKVAECELDALFYPDVGMEAFTYYLAFARLARLQFTTWGHPVTTGIPNMDFYVSSRHAEPDDASQRFYSEKLAVFDHLASYYLPPRPPSNFDPRPLLKSSPERRLYVCAQTMFKVHPDFDDALMDILRRDPQAHILLIGSAQKAWNEKLYRRLQRAGGELVKRIDFIGSLSLPDYLALVRGADALLDTFHFGGGMSSYESFAMGAPVVTLPAAMMRGRVTHALYRHMGVERWIARSPAHFAELAVELAHGQQRAQWREELLQGVARITEKDGVVREYETFIESRLASR